jgi:hypothetical protein
MRLGTIIVTLLVVIGVIWMLISISDFQATPLIQATNARNNADPPSNANADVA